MDQENKIRVVVAEDYSGLSAVMHKLIDNTSDLQCCGRFGTGKETLEALKELKPDVVSLDLSMPEMNGFAVLKKIREEWPEVRCIVFSGFGEHEYVRQALEAGAHGYVFKGDFEEFIECLREAAAGRRFLSSRFRDVDNLPA
ncbi:MAG: response regulator [Puniceicoccales bacterium]